MLGWKKGSNSSFIRVIRIDCLQCRWMLHYIGAQVYSWHASIQRVMNFTFLNFEVDENSTEKKVADFFSLFRARRTFSCFSCGKLSLAHSSDVLRVVVSVIKKHFVVARALAVHQSHPTSTTEHSSLNKEWIVGGGKNPKVYPNKFHRHRREAWQSIKKRITQRSEREKEEN